MLQQVSSNVYWENRQSIDLISGWYWFACALFRNPTAEDVTWWLTIDIVKWPTGTRQASATFFKIVSSKLTQFIIQFSLISSYVIEQEIQGPPEIKSHAQVMYDTFDTCHINVKLCSKFFKARDESVVRSECLAELSKIFNSFIWQVRSARALCTLSLTQFTGIELRIHRWAF